MNSSSAAKLFGGFLRNIFKMKLHSHAPKSQTLRKLKSKDAYMTREIVTVLMAQMIEVVAPIYFLILFPVMYLGPNSTNYAISEVTYEFFIHGLIQAGITFILRFISIIILLSYTHRTHLPITSYLLEVLDEEKYVYFFSIAFVASISVKYTLFQANTNITKLHLGLCSWQQ